MSKKRKSKLWAAWVWLLTGVLHSFYLLVKSIAGLSGFIFSKAYKAGKQAAMEKYAEAVYRPVTVEKKLAGDLAEFEKKLSSKSTIGLILGARGSGKSALGMRILENMAAKGRKVCAMGFDGSALPGWIRPVNGVDEIPNGYFVLVDEGGILFSSRSS